MPLARVDIPFTACFLLIYFMMKAGVCMQRTASVGSAISKKKKKHLRELFSGYGFIGLWLIGFVAFSVGPLLFSLIISFFQWGLLDAPVFVGFRNYIQMFTIDPLFLKSIQVTLTYALISVPASLVIAFLMAMLLNMKVKGMSLFRTLFYLPSVITGVAVSVVWMWVLQPDFGILNYFLGFLGIQGPDWLGNARWSLISLIIVSIWGSCGSQIVIYLAGLQNVPPALYEAADLDGAGNLRKLWNITLPMMTPTIFFNLIMGIIAAFRTFTQAYVMTAGGPSNSTMFYALYLYNKAFRDMQMGYASALSWILFIIIAFFTVLTFKSSSSWVYYESERRN